MRISLPQQFKQTTSDILTFLKSPQDEHQVGQKKKEKLKALLIVFCINVAVASVLAGIIEALSSLGLFSTDNHAVANLMRSMPLWGFLLLIVVVVPFIEELIFRYGLRFKQGYVTALLVITLLIAGVFGFYALPFTGALAVTAGIIVVFTLYVMKLDVLMQKLEHVWPKVYGLVFYAVAFIFGLIHISNYTGFNYASAAVLLVPVLVAPQIIGGLLMGYMRVKHGFLWGYYLHAGNNAFFFLMGLLFMNSIEEKLNSTNDGYTIKVEEHMQYMGPDETKISYMGHDSIAFVNEKLNDVIAKLLQGENLEVELDKTKYQHTSINLGFKNFSADSDLEQSKKLVLEELQDLYKFDVNYRSMPADAWDFAVADSDKLVAHAVTASTVSNTTKVEHKQDAIILENVTLDDLLQTITEEHEVMLITDRQALTDGRYNFTVAKKGIEQLKDELLSKYGIKLQSRMQLANKAVISFE